MMDTNTFSDRSSVSNREREMESKFIIPDFIEIESTKTKMYKLITEGFCYKSPDYSLSWKVSPCKVDLTIKNTLYQRKNNKHENQIKHEATLHTLRYVPNGSGFRNKFESMMTNNYIPIPDDSSSMDDNNGRYTPPEIYDISGGSESLKNSIDIDSVNNMDDFRSYIQSNMV